MAKGLIAKGFLAAAAAGTAVALGVIYREDIESFFGGGATRSQSIIDKVGLNCDTLTNVCTLKEGVTTINVKHSADGAVTKFNLTNASQDRRIKLYREAAEYNDKLKFVIEGGDIDLTAAAGESPNPTITKLEEFESYEIKKDGSAGKEYYLLRRNNSNQGKREVLGLPAGCALPVSTDPSTCSNIDVSQLGEIKFDGKHGEQAPAISSDNSQVTLTITKTDETDFFPEGGFKFSFNSADGDVTIPRAAEGSAPITIKANTKTEFKIKRPNQNQSALTLEKAWNLETLAGKIGLTECTSETSTEGTKECKLPATINVFNDSSNYKEEASVTGHDGNKKITFAVDQAGHNQGYKFTVTTALGLGTPATGKATAGSVENIETGISYEIKEQEVTEGKKWFLSKVSGSVGS